MIQKYLKGKGVIESDDQEQGVHDYRKDACLTMRDFEEEKHINKLPRSEMEKILRATSAIPVAYPEVEIGGCRRY